MVCGTITGQLPEENLNSSVIAIAEVIKFSECN